jgi:hypothetical protein
MLTLSRAVAGREFRHDIPFMLYPESAKRAEEQFCYMTKLLQSKRLTCFKPLLSSRLHSSAKQSSPLAPREEHSASLRQTLGDNKTRGTEQRDAGHVENPTARLKP